MKKKVTIKDVAKAAGVSHQTVSRVINKKPDVAKETRQRVWQVINELNYRPSALARSLKRQRSLTLGVVTAGLKYLGPSVTLSGIAKQAEELGYTLLLKELPSFHANNVHPLLNSLLARQVDGIIWAVSEIGDNRDWIQQEAWGSDVPIIFLTMEEVPGIPIVRIDNYFGGRLATEHLIEQGYTHIGHLSGPLDWWEARQRLDGWRDALNNAGLPVADCVSGNWSSISGAQEIVQLLQNYPEIDAVFVANDQMAMGVLQVLCQRGIRVPEDLGLVGFDGTPETAHYLPPLTTVSQNLRHLGSLAVEELVRIIEVDHQGHEVSEISCMTIQPELIVRESSINTIRETSK